MISLMPDRSSSTCPYRIGTIRVLAASLGGLLLCLALRAQSYTGRILGSVHDKSDAVLVGAKVDITDVQRNLTRSLVTDQAGEFVAPDLLPGIYKVHAEARGFKA